MEYNDYQLFDDSTFSTLKQEYQTKSKTDRKTTINHICFELQACKNYCLSFSNTFNKIITQQIYSCKNELTKLLDNIRATFNVNISNNNIYNNFNLFKLLKKLFNLINLFQTWQSREDKEYYKFLIKNSLSSLIEICTNIISACEESEIKFFKFM